MITYKFPQLYELGFKIPPLLIWRKKSRRLLIKELKKLDINVRKILDVGCGTGGIIPELKKLYKEAVIVGIDTSYNMIKESKIKYGREAKFIVINFLDCVGNYDLILLIYTPPYIELKLTIRKIMELLNKNGVCIIITIQKAPFSLLYKLFVKILLKTQVYLYSPKEIFSHLIHISSSINVKMNIIDEIEGSFLFLLKKN